MSFKKEKKAAIVGVFALFTTACSTIQRIDHAIVVPPKKALPTASNPSQVELIPPDSALETSGTTTVAIGRSVWMDEPYCAEIETIGTPKGLSVKWTQTHRRVDDEACGEQMEPIRHPERFSFSAYGDQCRAYRVDTPDNVVAVVEEEADFAQSNERPDVAVINRGMPVNPSLCFAKD